VKVIVDREGVSFAQGVYAYLQSQPEETTLKQVALKLKLAGIRLDFLDFVRCAREDGVTYGTLEVWLVNSGLSFFRAQQVLQKYRECQRELKDGLEMRAT